MNDQDKRNTSHHSTDGAVGAILHRKPTRTTFWTVQRPVARICARACHHWELVIKHRLLRYFGQPGNSWRYALAYDYSMHSEYLRGVVFQNRWLTIKDGDLVVKAGYAWDGCSPCVSVLGLFYFGPPDGAQLFGNPATYHASLVHDALCQFRDVLPISKATSVAIFRELLDKARFPLARVYATAVAVLGPQQFQLASSFPQRIRASRRKHIPRGSGT